MDDENPDSFEARIRAIAQEVGRSLEEMMDQMDVEGAAGMFGADPATARQRFEDASRWLRERVEGFGDEMTARSPRPPDPRPSRPVSGEDPLVGARPHPLDLPTDEQGLALAALESGRWRIEPGSDALAANGEGPGPSDALGLARELRAHDWVTAEGEVTVVGRHALGRWLAAAKTH